MVKDKSMNERVKEVRLRMDVSQAKFGEEIGFSQGAIRDVELGKCGVSQRLILSMQKKLGVSEEWLRTGNGTMYAQPEANKDEVKEFADKMNLSDVERKILSIYLKLSATDRKKLEDFAVAFANKAAAEDIKTAPGAEPEAGEKKVAESPAEYEARRMPDKEDFIRQVELETATRGKLSVSPVDDGRNVV